MQKAKTFDLEDSNVALLGSKEDKAARLKAADTETAWKDENPETNKPCGDGVGQWLWRIEKFKVVAWPREEYGNFFSGDSYILLQSVQNIDPVTKQPMPKLSHDIHFWIGKDSSQDEYGTAAYKTVELDDYVNGKYGSDPVQHREVEGQESSLFLSYFPKGIKFQSGGCATGFRHVEPTTYRNRLLHIKGKKNCVVREVPMAVSSMNKGDIFILDAGMDIYQWSGSKAGIMEKGKAAELVRALDDERGSKPKIEVFDERTCPPSKKFWDMLGGKAQVPEAIPDDVPLKSVKKMLKVSDASGKLEMTEVTFGKDSLDTNDAFIVDVGTDVFLWTGRGASDSEKANAMGYATNYLKEKKRPLGMPITALKEGSFSAHFNSVMS